MKRSLLVLLLAALLCLSACAATTETREFNGEDAQEVTIGVAYPVEKIGADTLFAQGVALAVEHINAAGGVLGKPLATYIRDDANDNTAALQIAQTFVDKGISAVIGHWSSDVCYVTEELYEENGVVMITPASTSLSLFEKPYDFIFRMISNNNAYAQAIARDIAEHGEDNIAIYYTDDVYGRDLANRTERALAEEGITVIDRISNITPANAQRIEDRWTAFDCQAVVVAAVMPTAGEVVSTVRRMANTPPIVGADNFDRISFSQAMQGNLDSLYMASYDDASLDQAFLAAFEEANGCKPDIFAIAGYEAAVLLADAMNATQSLDGADIAAHLKSLTDYPSVAGILSYNPQTQEFDGHELYIQALEP